VIRRAPKTGTLFVLEEVPFKGRRRCYCHLDGADAPSFDDLEEAVIWGLDRAAGVVVRTLELGFYLAGEHPPDWGHDLDLRPWPPSKSDRLRIEGAYVAAVALAAQDEVDQRAYEAARRPGSARTPRICGQRGLRTSVPFRSARATTSSPSRNCRRWRPLRLPCPGAGTVGLRSASRGDCGGLGPRPG
jgi:hypothetical protein